MHIHIHIYIYTHMCVYVSINACMCMCMYMCMYIYIYIHVYIDMHIHTDVYIYIYIYVYVYVVHMCSDAYSFRLRTLLPLAVRKPSMVSVAAYRPRRSESASISVRPDACRSYIRASLSTHLHQAAHVMC